MVYHYVILAIHFLCCFAYTLEYQTQPLLFNMVLLMVSLSTIGFGLFLVDHAVFRWIYFIEVQILLVLDTYWLAVQLQRLDCQLEFDCSELDSNEILLFAALSRYFAIFCELTGAYSCSYMFFGLGICSSARLPRDVGVPEHVRLLAEAARRRKELEKRNPEAWKKNKAKMPFDPNDPFEQHFDHTVDGKVGEVDRTSAAISRVLKGLAEDAHLQKKKDLHQGISHDYLKDNDYLDQGEGRDAGAIEAHEEGDEVEGEDREEGEEGDEGDDDDDGAAGALGFSRSGSPSRKPTELKSEGGGNQTPAASLLPVSMQEASESMEEEDSPPREPERLGTNHLDDLKVAASIDLADEV
uniref:Transmembrane protein n=1 Tax=Chromera velia CCMP2878 TaxID=1169474 RepID=A0A0G4IBV2_9ALVE|eukprot:Cvel_2215.t1-p1 / transcript=Cvel_2215.t1 / gene=Cvel_2215 / organism=Chromera_velia_CCMP2878 / gene_product=hypothetical protein / transcript_product=hypothetical protein / location=Cvel_scaffold85:111139-114999(-) / protein_length=353 / sequence_SO=supercontig / SO=protein_coding / is_pseudo=false